VNVVRVAAAIAGAVLTAFLAAGCGAQSPAAQPGTVQACADYGVRAIEHHVTVTWMPAACRGLSKAQVNQAVGKAIYLVAGGRHKAAWRRQAYLASARLAYLTSPPQRTASSRSRGSAIPGSPAPAGRGSDVALGFASLGAWLLAAGSGSYMLGVWISHGGIRRLLTGGPRLQPVVIVGHVTLAAAGLTVWIVYLTTDEAALAWTAVGLLLPVAGLGMALVTLGSSGEHVGSGTATAGSGSAGLGSAGVGSAGVAGAVTAGTVAASSVAVGTATVGTVTAAGPRAAPAAAARRGVPVLVVIGHGLLAAATVLLVLLAALGAAGS
jgi:manganese efflux pump family protein